MKIVNLLFSIFFLQLCVNAQDIIQSPNSNLITKSCTKLNNSGYFFSTVQEINNSNNTVIAHLIKTDKDKKVYKKLAFVNNNDSSIMNTFWSRFMIIDGTNKIIIPGNYTQGNKYGIFLKTFDEDLNLINEYKLELGSVISTTDPSYKTGVGIVNIIQLPNEGYYFALNKGRENLNSTQTEFLENLILLTDTSLNIKSSFSEKVKLEFAADWVDILADFALNPINADEIVILKRQNQTEEKGVTLYTLNKNLTFKKKYSYKIHNNYSIDTNIIFPFFQGMPNLAVSRNKLLVSGLTYDITKDSNKLGEKNPINIFSLQLDSFTVEKKYLETDKLLLEDIIKTGSPFNISFGNITIDRRIVTSKSNATYTFNTYFSKINFEDTLEYGFYNTRLRVSKFDNNLNLIWKKNISIPQRIIVHNITTNENNIAICGSYINRPIELEKPFLMLLDTFGNPITGFPDIENNRSNGAVVYPNPSKGNFTFEVVNSQIKSMDVYDVSGRLIIKENITNPTESHQLNLSNYANGMYFYTIVLTDGTSSSGKLLKE